MEPPFPRVVMGTFWKNPAEAAVESKVPRCEDVCSNHFDRNAILFFERFQALNLRVVECGKVVSVAELLRAPEHPTQPGKQGRSVLKIEANERTAATAFLDVGVAAPAMKQQPGMGCDEPT